MARKSNQELCAEFRKLMTETAQTDFDEETLAITKPWRNKLWREFKAIEKRLCPQPYEEGRSLD